MVLFFCLSILEDSGYMARAGVAKGKILMAQDAICQYLAARLGVESQALQETVRTITDLDTLSWNMNQIFIVTTLDEATSLIHNSAVSL